MRIRSLAVGLIVLGAAAIVLRLGLVSALAQRDPIKAASLWPGHPDLIFASGLEEVGRAAAQGKPVAPDLVDRMMAATRIAPLATEPFLVRGVQAQLAGDERLAGQAFAEARLRDPRSIPARYFLADHYLRTGQVQPGLDEIATLARLVPHSAEKIAPFLATFAKMPGASRSVKSVLRDHPELEPVLLRILSVDATNSDTVLSLWSGGRGADASGWQERLVREMVTSGQVDKAYAAWSRFAGRPSGDLLLNAPFDGRGTPPPFGWRLVSGPEGIAEAAGEGQLHVIHYGRSSLALASRMMVLPPGNYRMAMRVSGAPAAAKRIRWSLRCLPSNSELITFDLGQAPDGALVRSFNIPPGCSAQQLDLTATAPDFPEQADVTISAFQIQAGGGR